MLKYRPFPLPPSTAVRLAFEKHLLTFLHRRKKTDYPNRFDRKCRGSSGKYFVRKAGFQILPMPGEREIVECSPRYNAVQRRQRQKNHSKKC